jgi:hypothetical protein
MDQAAAAASFGGQMQQNNPVGATAPPQQPMQYHTQPPQQMQPITPFNNMGNGFYPNPNFGFMQHQMQQQLSVPPSPDGTGTFYGNPNLGAGLATSMMGAGQQQAPSNLQQMQPQQLAMMGGAPPQNMMGHSMQQGVPMATAARAPTNEAALHDPVDSSYESGDSGSDSGSDSDSDSDGGCCGFKFEGRYYDTYTHMVAAKRKRNEMKLASLLDKMKNIEEEEANLLKNARKRRKSTAGKKVKGLDPVRSSGRKRGEPAKNIYVETEYRGTKSLKLGGSDATEEQKKSKKKRKHTNLQSLDDAEIAYNSTKMDEAKKMNGKKMKRTNKYTCICRKPLCASIMRRHRAIGDPDKVTEVVIFPKHHKKNTPVAIHTNAYRVGVKNQMLGENACWPEETGKCANYFQALIHYRKGPIRDAIKKSYEKPSIVRQADKFKITPEIAAQLQLPAAHQCPSQYSQSYFALPETNLDHAEQEIDMLEIELAAKEGYLVSQLIQSGKMKGCMKDQPPKSEDNEVDSIVVMQRANKTIKFPPSSADLDRALASSATIACYVPISVKSRRRDRYTTRGDLWTRVEIDTSKLKEQLIPFGAKRKSQPMADAGDTAGLVLDKDGSLPVCLQQKANHLHCCIDKEADTRCYYDTEEGQAYWLVGDYIDDDDLLHRILKFSELTQEKELATYLLVIIRYLRNVKKSTAIWKKSLRGMIPIAKCQEQLDALFAFTVIALSSTIQVGLRGSCGTFLIQTTTNYMQLPCRSGGCQLRKKWAPKGGMSLSYMEH